MDAELIELGYGLKMEGKEQACRYSESSRVSDLGNWIVGVLSFFKMGNHRIHFPSFQFLQ